MKNKVQQAEQFPMRCVIYFLFSIFLLCVLCNSVVRSSSPEEPRWLGDWEEARKIARLSNKPLFVVFRCQH